MMSGAKKKGFTLTEIFTVVAILAILTALALPNFMAMRLRVQKDSCINNLRQLKLAKEQWALEKNKDYEDTPAANDLDPYIRDTTQSLICPLDPAKSFSASYNINNVGTNPACKISTSHRL